MAKKPLTFVSLFAGIGGFDLGFERAGMACKGQVEIDADARRVLATRFPNAKRFTDVRECGKRNLRDVDVICGGFPCQDLSVAGKRKGLKGERSGLFFQMSRIVEEVQPELCIFENVPGLLSNDGGRSAALVLWEFASIGFHGGWRVLDSQYFGVPQRRDRVFGCFARGRAGAGRAAEILALAEGRGRHSQTRGKAGQGIAKTLRSRSHSPGVAPPGRGGEDDDNLIVGSMTSKWAKGSGGPSDARNGRGQPEPICPALSSSETGTHGDSKPHLMLPNGVRRLMPVECLRLQAFPDDWLDLDPTLSDSAKYRMIGNAVTVNVAEWIGRRIVKAMT